MSSAPPGGPVNQGGRPGTSSRREAPDLRGTPPRFLDVLIGELHPEGAAGSHWFHLHERLRFWDGHQIWTVPKGFACDLASIPWWARGISSWQSWRPGILHDYLVREVTSVNRLEADALFATALESEDLAFWRQIFMYGAVRVHAAWRWMARQASWKEGPQ